MTRCLDLDTYTALGIPELTAEVCRIDEVLTRQRAASGVRKDRHARPGLRGLRLLL